MLGRKAATTLTRVRTQLGREVFDERRRRRWSLAGLAARAGLSVATVQRVESGQPASLDAIVAIGVALNLEPTATLRSPARALPPRDADPVHAAMGEIEARHFQTSGGAVRLDEPYQHYQFAGRADLVVIDLHARAVLHVENRTRFPDIQEFAGSWNAKRSYLAHVLAQREGVKGGWRSVDHVIVALWSSEVLHTLRLRRQSFTALASDAAASWAAWWDGSAIPAGTRSTIVLFDPLPGARRSRRRWVGLDQLDRVEPRYRGYADALAALRGSGLA